jgi:hypothetical protein
MVWMDSIMAVPTIGLQIEPQFRFSGRFTELIAPMLEERIKRGEMLNLSSNDPAKLVVNTSTGLVYTLTLENIGIDHRIPQREVKSAGQLRHIEAVPVGGFSELLEVVRVEIDNVVRLLRELAPIKVTRVGILAVMTMHRDAMPPGLKLLVDHLARPWGAPLQRCETTLTAILNEEPENYTDRCHHGVAFDTTSDPKDIGFRLDWQRLLHKSVELGEGWAAEHLSEWVSQAIRYYDRVGEGALSYA